MFRTERMAYLRLLLLREDVLRTTGELARREVLHPESEGPGHGPDPELSEELEGLLRRIESLRSKLGIGHRPLRPQDVPLDPKGLISEAEGKVSELEERIGEVEAKREELSKREEDLIYQVRAYELLEELNLELSEEPRYVDVAVGRLPRAQADGIEDYVGDLTCAWDVKPVGRDEAVVVLAGQRGTSDALSGLRFAPVELRKGITSEELELERWRIREELADVAEEVEHLREEWGERLCFWEEAVRANLRLLREMERFSGTEEVAEISGFVPLRECPEVCKEIERLTGGRFYAEYSPVEEVGKEEDAPSKFSNPRFLRAFESLVATYGLPPYGGLDPTPILAVVFPVMFGAMFGDVGHGILLALAGAFLAFHRKFRRKLGNMGEFLLYMGGASVIFGLLFGSAFGLEFEPLWFRPSEDTIRFMGLSVGFGVVVLSLGVLLNVLQALRREPSEALFGRWGALSGAFYWGGLALVIRSGEVPLVPAALVLGLPLLLMILGSIWARRDVVEVLMGPVEVVMGYFANTISYVRIAAFGLTHAALMSSVFTIADMLPREAEISTIVEGNLLVVGLEGLIVTIQCMRLTYYEFFSKFFLEQGRPFRPLRLR